MTEKVFCPRSAENGGGPNSTFKAPFNGEMHWHQKDKTCSYCGSLDPDYLMQRLELGDIEIGPTDKNYKIYVRNKGGLPFYQTFRNCQPEDDCRTYEDCTHWKTEQTEGTKFYFQHFSDEQKARFVELYNDKKLHMGHPGHFYVIPFFCKAG